MRRLIVVLLICLSSFLWSQTAQPAPASDPQALSLVHKSIAALTGGATITDVTLNGNVISILGSDNETGTGTFEVKGVSESRVDLNLSGGTRSDVRNTSNSFPAGAWQKNGGNATPYAQHNCWTDAAWFFPALSSLVQTVNPNYVFKYIGQELHAGLNVQHIRVLQQISQLPSPVSTTDFYLDVTSLLPLAIAFNLHADSDMNTNIANEIRFANYKTLQGIQVPFHLQRIVNGTVVLDAVVTNALFNTGLQDVQFVLQ